MNVCYIPAFKDNYIWVLVEPSLRSAIVIDPGDATAVLAYLNKHQLSLEAIWITHKHPDHCGGVQRILNQFNLSQIKVYGPCCEALPMVNQVIKQGDQIEFFLRSNVAKIIEIPGHTSEHIAFYVDKKLFCGDTLFAGGCGRVFDSSIDLLFQSLKKIAALPQDTEIYCAHEYTLSNLKFALLVEPENENLQMRFREIENICAQNEITLPSTLGIELKTNPFLRCHIPEVKKSVENQIGHILRTELEIFAALREWKNEL